MNLEHAEKISVIVPACNAEPYISRCLDSLLRNTLVPSEIIVVDDHSEDGTAVAVEAHKNRIVKLVRMGSRDGAGAARNRGIAVATGTLLFFLDSDCMAAQDWIERGVEAFRNSEIVGVFGAIYYETIPTQIREKIPVNPFYHSPLVNPVNGRFPDFAAGNVAYRAEIARRLDGFDTRLFKNGREDTDFALRALQFGRVVYQPQMKVTHSSGTWTWGQLRASAKRYQSDVIFFGKYQKFAFCRGRVLHPKMLLLALFPLAIPVVYGRWLRSLKDWLFLPFLWLYFLLVRWNIFVAAVRERVVVF